MKQNPLIQMFLRICEMNYIASRCVAIPCEDWSWCDLGLRKTILGMSSEEIRAESPVRTIEPQTIYYIVDGFQCIYAIMPLEEQELLFCGPIMAETLTAKRMWEILERQQIPEALHQKVSDYCYNVPHNPINQHLGELFAALAEGLYGKGSFQVRNINSSDPINWHEFHSNQFHVSDVPFENMHLMEQRYYFENEIISAVRNANEERALELHTKVKQFILPPRMTNELRDQKDYMITFNTLMRKAAEQAGVHPIQIDSMSNSHVKQIEEIASVDRSFSFTNQMIVNYCKLIRRFTRKNHSLMVQKVLTYIDTNLCADLSLKAFSENLSINASYLSTLFKKEMGISLTEYVNQKRILHAQRLIVSTNLPVKSIAQQCGIPDICYFSRMFKKISGITPKEYRETVMFHDIQE